ncbi:MAG: hypothetical protein K8U03_19395 [Planctomycetia bacterium]|nr:hypothetical protein [Planctomycetia bacterium]
MNYKASIVIVVSLIIMMTTLESEAADPETPPAFAWTVSGGGKLSDKVRGVCFDSEGNVFLAGETTEGAKFAGVDIPAAAGMNFFLAKLDADGKRLWVRSGGGSLIDRAYGVATDREGNCYVTGHYQSPDADFDGVNLPQRGTYDIFVAKYDRDGKLLWIQTGGGAGYDYGHGIAIDGRGDVIVTGAVVGKGKFGDLEVGDGTGAHIFWAKYHADGRLAWVKAADGQAGGAGHGVAVDGRDQIYIAGITSGSGRFGDQPLVTPKGSSAVIAKLSSTGDVLWISQHFGEASCLFHEIACDAEGRVWACGMFKGRATFGGETFTTTGPKDSDAFLSHFTADGKLAWTRVGQGPAVDYGLGVATDGRGNSYLTGEFTADFRLAGATLQSRGGVDVYVAKFDAAGTLRWITQAGGATGDNAYTLARDTKHGIVIGGSFSGTAKFGDAEITSGGASDLYVAKLKVE